MEDKTPRLTEVVKNELMPLPFKCGKCPRSFKSRPALHMHNLRAHGKLRGQPRLMTRKPNVSDAERKRRKREYQFRLRARYYAQGKNSRGEQMPPGWKPRPRKNSKETEYRRQYKRDWAAAKAAAKRIEPIVYAGPIEAPKNKVCYCPYCGENLERIINL